MNYECQNCHGHYNNAIFTAYRFEGNLVCNVCYEYLCIEHGIEPDIADIVTTVTATGTNGNVARIITDDTPVNQPEVEKKKRVKVTEKDAPDIPKEKVLELIDPKRTFGIEFEMYGGSTVKLREQASKLNYRWSGDGSIQDNNGNRAESGIEFQTCISIGKEGGNAVYAFLEKANEYNFKVNSSCGTHIHLDAKDFFDNFEYSISSIDKITDETEVFVIERTLLNNMSESFGSKSLLETTLSDVAVMANTRGGYSGSYRMADGKLSRYSTGRIYLPSNNGYRGYNGYTYIVRNSTLDKLNITPEESIEGSKNIYLSTLDNHGFSKSDAKVDIRSIVIFTRQRSQKYHDLKKLMLVYHLYDPLFFAMLPKERANSRYCKPLSQSYSAYDIGNCRSQQDIERLWYKKIDYRDIRQAKGEHYEPSRYHAVNLHAMFYKYGTVEIRSHHGTLDPTSILLWTALHQTIIERVKSGHFGWYQPDRNPAPQKIEDLISSLVKSAGIKDTPLEEFIRFRVKKYSK